MKTRLEQIVNEVMEELDYILDGDFVTANHWIDQKHNVYAEVIWFDESDTPSINVTLEIENEDGSNEDLYIADGAEYSYGSLKEAVTDVVTFYLERCGG